MRHPPDEPPLREVVGAMLVKVEVLANDVQWLKRVGLWIVAGLVTNIGLMVAQMITGVK